MKILLVLALAVLATAKWFDPDLPGHEGKSKRQDEVASCRDCVLVENQRRGMSD